MCQAHAATILPTQSMNSHLNDQISPNVFQCTNESLAPVKCNDGGSKHIATNHLQTSIRNNSDEGSFKLEDQALKVLTKVHAHMACFISSF